jgi:hypothetical protein
VSLTHLVDSLCVPVLIVGELGGWVGWMGWVDGLGEWMGTCAGVSSLSQRNEQDARFIRNVLRHELYTTLVEKERKHAAE